MKSRAQINCSGIVQGIGYRPFVYRMAIKYDLRGFVRNMGDAGVYIIVEGEKKHILSFLDSLNNEKPYIAKYESFYVNWHDHQNEFSDFVIIKSSSDKTSGISYLPPDISICENCLEDMKNPKDNRFKYAFTSCAICGPRYTTITDLPYDRPNTTMVDFPLCPDCEKEYTNPLDRRYHAQTTCCNKCGPSFTFYNNKGEKIQTKNVIDDVVALLNEGNIIAIKGIGGTHLACSTINDEPILRLRVRKGKRKYKPFAIISREIDQIQKYAKISSLEERLLKSYRKPIVLLEKNEPFPLSKWLSPNLHNIGVMLPYSGIHSLILDKFAEPAMVLTSANPSDIPMYIDNETILKKSGELADFILMHNRRIYQRSDDSVIRITNNQPAIIRRSRGYVPEPINLPFNIGDEISLGVGPLLTSTGAIVLKNRCFPTQYIGDINTIESYDFLESAIKHLAHLLDVERYDTIGYDLHPNFLSSNLAIKLSAIYNSRAYEIQHHHAHAAALMIDNTINKDEEIVAIIADGVGYGDDGKIWGGEIFHCNYSNYKRIGHLEEQKMIGGDRATYFPIRMAAGILSKYYSDSELSKLLSEIYVEGFPGKESEIQVLLVQLKKGINVYESTSTGRILASASALLKTCYERTYEGEPSIALESLAKKGKKDKVQFQLKDSKNGMIDTSSLIYQVYLNYIQGEKPADIAFAVHYELANQFADVAIDYAKNNSINKIGFSGGVAYNDIIVKQLNERISNEKLEFLLHKNLPCGDGCISSGQAIVAHFRDK